MKRKTAWLAVLLFAALMAALLSGCGSPRYTVTFDLNGGELLSGELTQKVKAGESAELPEVQNGDKVLTWEGDPTNITADTTVTANWQSWFTVSFDLNGGELVSGELEQRVLEGEDAQPPEAVYGRRELTWDGDWRGVTGDTTVTAQWTKVAMDTVDLAEYVQDRTVTVNVRLINGGESAGSGFFIDSDGTLVTNFHVIELGSSMTVETAGGAIYPVKEILGFSNLYDLAVLRLDLRDCPYLEFSDKEARTGEHVYAVGSALGTLKGSFTAGIVSSTKRTYGMIECLQMDTPISPGNSGGPLVNVYGEVVGINVASFTSGESLNLAIKPSTLDKLDLERHMSVKDFEVWYRQESSRSWSPIDSEGYACYSLVHTYQEVTGANCLATTDENDNVVSESYIDEYPGYIYTYDSKEYDAYTEYLQSVGFEYDSSKEFSDGISYYYYNEKEGILLDLFIFSDHSRIWVMPLI